MSFDPTLGETRESYDLAVGLGYDWVARVHNGEVVRFCEMNLPPEPFIIDGDHVIIRELSLDRFGGSRHNRRGDAIILHVRRRPLPDGCAQGASTQGVGGDPLDAPDSGPPGISLGSMRGSKLSA